MNLITKSLWMTLKLDKHLQLLKIELMKLKRMKIGKLRLLKNGMMLPKTMLVLLLKIISQELREITTMMQNLMFHTNQQRPECLKNH